MSLKKLGIPIYYNILNIFSLYGLLIYYPFFILGILFSCSGYIEKNLSNKNLIYLLIVISSLYFLNDYIKSNDYSVIITKYLHYIYVLFFVIFVFNVFMKFFNAESTFWLYMSNASYTIYIFHHLIVISLGVLLSKSTFNANILLLFVIIATFLLCLAIHHFFILKFKLLSFMYNGK